MSDDANKIFQEVAGAYDLPAFLRRAHEVEAAWESIVARCSRERRRLLEIPRLRLAVLSALCDRWQSPLIAVLCRSDDISALAELERAWTPELKRPLNSTSRPGDIKMAVRRLIHSFERFNNRWTDFVDRVSLDRVNQLRTDYNRYYVIEKECAVRSLLTAQRGFEPMPPASLDEVRELFPLLRVPRDSNRTRIA